MKSFDRLIFGISDVINVISMDSSPPPLFFKVFFAQLEIFIHSPPKNLTTFMNDQHQEIEIKRERLCVCVCVCVCDVVFV
jgi:hypothetical protein